MSDPSVTVTGVILAGGRSSRFGSNKALALYRGRPLIEHVARVLSGLFDRRLLVTNSPEEYAFLGWPMTGDLTPGAGPLAGIEAACAAIETPWAFITACDMPRLDPEPIRRLCAQADDGDVVLPAPNGQREPLHALYHRRILPEISAALARGERRISDLLARLRVRELNAAELGLDSPAHRPFININFTQELEALQNQRLQPTLEQAQRLILGQTRPGPGETLPLAAVLGRIPTAPVRARLAVPSFPQACRDGYALRAADTRAATPNHKVSLNLQGEIAAGHRGGIERLDRGGAYRIMTGGMVPAGADSVIPFEEVSHEGERRIELATPCRPGTHVRPVGTDLRRNQVIVPAGCRIEPDHLPRLATAGVGEIEVFVRPRVGLLCTGSELLDDTGENPAPGNLIGGNRFLLAGLIRRCGAEPVDLGTVPDDGRRIAAALSVHREQGLAAIISTGGMGPGKYDLVGRVLEKLRAPVLYRELKVRPGKATMAALLGETLFFGLPGPPPAVHLLFHLLIAPALRRLQGDRRPRPQLLRARLLHPLQVRHRGVIHLKEAVLIPQGERLTVRSPRPGEALNGVMLIPAHRRALKRGELVGLIPVP
ncbi:NTP transferase domain-containing protein [Desulfurivibrio sp. D14AmB]|uniref:NTP transferase domain-containing protein n=1 Tax=Desulfurivibrio sp. D14AmB TaxID=3374370 RepID=UPI00376F340E